MADRFAELGLFLFTLVGWSLLLYVIVAVPVSPGAQLLFYGAGFVAIAGSVALVGALYQARSRRDESRLHAMSFLGLGLRLAFAVEFALWLQSLRLLTPSYLIFIAAGFFLLEILLRSAGGDRRGLRE
jgi:hypothetical protein